HQYAALVEVTEAALQGLALQPDLDWLADSKSQGQPAYADWRKPSPPPSLIPRQEALGEGPEDIGRGCVCSAFALQVGGGISGYKRVRDNIDADADHQPVDRAIERG